MIPSFTYFPLVKRKKKTETEKSMFNARFIIDERKELLSVVLSVGGFGRMGPELAIESD